MSCTLAICHGPFGRATLHRFARPLMTHTHREGHLVVHLDGPPGIMEIAGRAHRVGPGEAVAINPWEPHAFWPSDPTRGCLNLVLYIRPGWFVEASRQATAALRFGRAPIEITGALARQVLEIAQLMADAPASGRLERELLAFTRACLDRSWQWTPEPAPAPPPRPTDFRIRRALRLIAERLGHELPFDRVAREAGLSRPHFYKMFKSQLGITPNLYLNTLRVEGAIERLVAGGGSVTEIGYALGFACQSSFTRFFAANVGLPPTEYRRRARLL